MKSESVKFYQVGGCVRDALMGIKSKDIDYSVEASSYDAMRLAILARCGADSIKVEKPEYATIRAVDPKLGGVDFVLCRKDGAYTDGRRPDSVEMGTLYDDLARRDFTCNAIAQNDEGNIIDPFGGQQAIKKKELSCVGSADARLREDSLRMLRAIRFSITKDFNLDLEIQAFLLNWDNAKLLNNISAERIREELNKCFAFDTLYTLRILERYDAIKCVVFGGGKLSLEATMKAR